MVDREKVIKKDERIMYSTVDRDMIDSFCEDVIAVLKEQEAVEPDADSEGTCTCGNCGETVGYYPVGCKTPQRLCKFCPECGRRVKWE